MLICDRLQAELPRVFNALEISPFVPSRIEAQITASNDGDYFRGHADSGLLMFYRAITFVLYFFAEPQGFSGGNLRLYDSSEHNENDSSQRQFIEITPRQNTAVFFPSDVWHEVMPVHCPDKAFRHSRFTLNGWIDR
jgi:Rps23 Pro-64 3,4-dihydroxylase Tpa1-like proline 4-hydroxylase